MGTLSSEIGLAMDWVFITEGCSLRGVQWIGVVLYDKLVCEHHINHYTLFPLHPPVRSIDGQIDAAPLGNANAGSAAPSFIRGAHWAGQRLGWLKLPKVPLDSLSCVIVQGSLSYFIIRNGVVHNC